WHQDTALAGIRDAAALVDLPADERNAWQALWAQVPNLRPILPTSRNEGQQWRYTTQKPAEGWQEADFDDKQWQEGVGGFGTAKEATRHARTAWRTDDIWLRREFTLPEEIADDLVLLVNHDFDAEAYVNGVAAFKSPDWSTGDYAPIPLN